MAEQRPRLTSAPCARRGLLIVVALATLAAGPATAVEIFWQQASGDWFEPGNWDNGVPTRTDDAFVNNGGTPMISASSPLLPTGDIRVLRLNIGGGSLLAEAIAGALTVDGLDFAARIAMQVGAANGDNTGATGSLGNTGGSYLGAGTTSTVGSTAGSTVAGVTAEGTVITDGRFESGSTTVGAANAGNVATGSVSAGSGALVSSATVGSAFGGTAQGTFTVLGGGLDLSGTGLIVGQVGNGGQATGIVDIRTGALKPLSGAFDRDLSIGFGLSTGGIATGTLSAPLVDTASQGLGDVQVGVAGAGATAEGSLVLDAGDMRVTGDVEIGASTSGFGPGVATATGMLSLGGRADGDGEDDHFRVGHMSSIGLPVSGNAGLGDASGSAAVSGLGGFGEYSVGVAAGTVFETAAVTGTLEVGAGGIVGSAAGATLAVGSAVGTPNNNQVFGPGATVDGTLIVAGTGVDLQGGALDVGTTQNLGNATGSMTVQGGVVSAGTMRVGHAIPPSRSSDGAGGSVQSPVAPDARVAALGNYVQTAGGLAVSNLFVGVLAGFGDPGTADGTVNLTGVDVDVGAGGGFGTGSVLVGAANISPLAVGQSRGTGTLTLDGGSIDAAQIVIGTAGGADAPGSGTMNASNATVTTTGNVDVGAGFEAFARLSVTDSTLLVGDSLNVSRTFGTAFNDAAVTATRSTLEIGNDLLIGPAAQGAPGRVDLLQSTATVSDQVRVGFSSNLFSPTPLVGDATLALTDSQLTIRNDLYLDVGAKLSLTRSQVTIANDITMVNLSDALGARVQIGIDGTGRGTGYGAIDVEQVALDGKLDVTFNQTPDVDAFEFDLIVTRLADGITGDFAAVTLSGLNPDFSAATSIVVDDLGTGPVEIYRLSMTRVNFRGCDDNAPAAGTTVTCSAFDNVGVLAAPGATGIDVTVLPAVEVATAATTLALRGASRVRNDGEIRATGDNLPTVLLEGDRNSVTNAGTIRAQGAASPAIQVTGDGTRIVNAAGALIESATAEAIRGGDGAETLENHGALRGGAGVAVALGGGADTLVVAPGSSIIGLADGGGGSDTLVLGGAGAGTFDLGDVGAAEQFRSFESFRKEGASTWRLTGTNDGEWTLLGGTLLVDGSLSGAVTVQPGATLGGSGSVGATSNAGTIAPGNSIGTLTVNGDFVQQAGGVYAVEVDAAGRSDLIDVTGAATLDGGTVSVSPAPGAYAPQTTYTILRATGGVSGTFLGAVTDSAFLIPSLTYGSNDVFLWLTRNTTDFSDVAATFNQRSVAGHLDATSTTASGDYRNVVESLFGLSTVEAARALDTLSGELHASTADSMLRTGARFVSIVRAGASPGSSASISALADPGAMVASIGMAGGGGAHDAGASSARGAWLVPFGHVGDVDDDGNASSVDYSTTGVAGGLDAALTPKLRIGAAVGYASTDVDVDRDGAGSSDVDSYHGALYASHDSGDWLLGGVASFAHHDVKSARRITAGAVRRTATASYDANLLSVYAEGRRRLGNPGGAGIEPVVSVAYARVDPEDFTERGAGDLNLRVRPRTTESLRSVLGVRLQGEFAIGGGARVTPVARVGWSHEFLDRRGEIGAHFTGAPASAEFIVRGSTVDRNSVDLALGVTVAASDNWRMYAGYGALLGSNRKEHALAAGVRLRW